MNGKFNEFIDNQSRAADFLKLFLSAKKRSRSRDENLSLAKL